MNSQLFKAVPFALVYDLEKNWRLRSKRRKCHKETGGIGQGRKNKNQRRGVKERGRKHEGESKEMTI